MFSYDTLIVLTVAILLGFLAVVRNRRNPVDERPARRMTRFELSQHPLGPPPSGVPLPLDVLTRHCQDMTRVLGDSTFAFLGGGALMLLGYENRTTRDFNIVVPDNERERAVKLLRQLPGFGKAKDRGSKRCWIHTELDPDRAHNVDILSSKDVSANYDQNSPVKMVHGVKILHPAHILRTKVYSWLSGMRTPEKKVRDRWDILFLLRYLAAEGDTVDPNLLGDKEDKFFRQWIVTGRRDLDA